MLNLVKNLEGGKTVSGVSLKHFMSLLGVRSSVNRRLTVFFLVAFTRLGAISKYRGEPQHNRHGTS